MGNNDPGCGRDDDVDDELCSSFLFKVLQNYIVE